MLSGSVPSMLDSRIKPKLLAGTILELGPAKAWPAMSWLQSNPDLEWLGAGFGETEQAQAIAYAREHKLLPRVKFLSSPLNKIDLPERSIDLLFSFGGFWAWKEPLDIFNEIARILKVEGDFFVGDVRPDLRPWRAWLIRCLNPKQCQLYANRQRALGFADIRLLLDQSGLGDSCLEKKGPDFWIYKAD